MRPASWPLTVAAGIALALVLGVSKGFDATSLTILALIATLIVASVRRPGCRRLSCSCSPAVNAMSAMAKPLAARTAFEHAQWLRDTGGDKSRSVELAHQALTFGADLPVDRTRR